MDRVWNEYCDLSSSNSTLPALCTNGAENKYPIRGGLGPVAMTAAAAPLLHFSTAPAIFSDKGVEGAAADKEPEVEGAGGGSSGLDVPLCRLPRPKLNLALNRSENLDMVCCVCVYR